MTAARAGFRSLALLVVTLAALAAGTPGAAAEASDPARVTWALVPADDAGPDGRRVVDLELEPGATTTEHVALTNYSEVAVTFAMSANDGYLTERGSFDMLPSATPPSDGGAWIDVEPEVTVEPGATAVVPVTVTAPADAMPGDHPAGVAASLRTGSTVRVEHRVGVRFNLSAPGDAVASLSAAVTGTDYEPSWNPAEPGVLTVRWRVTNTGTVALGADVGVTATPTLLGPEAADAGQSVREVLPGGSQDGESRVRGVWPAGPLSVDVAATPHATDLGRVTPEAGPAHASARAWAVPLVPLLELALLAVTVLCVRLGLRRRRRQWDERLAAARAEGAARALAASTPTAGAPSGG